MLAYSGLRRGPLYRAECFREGLQKAGFEVRDGYPGPPGEVLLIWNRYGNGHAQAAAAEKQGMKVIVAENGYLGHGGTSPKWDVVGKHENYYVALALGGHNGQGRWPEGGPERFEQLGVELKPLRQGGDYILVCPNRAFGYPGRIMPMDWPRKVVERLRAQTNRPIRLRSHPGNDRPARSLAEDLKGAAAMVIWYSTAGIHALVEGIPVVCEAPTWICKGAAYSSLDELQTMCDPWEVRRKVALQRMAWAQWTLDEVKTGEPFRRLLSL